VGNNKFNIPQSTRRSTKKNNQDFTGKAKAGWKNLPGFFLFPSLMKMQLRMNDYDRN